MDDTTERIVGVAPAYIDLRSVADETRPVGGVEHACVGGQQIYIECETRIASGRHGVGAD